MKICIIVNYDENYKRLASYTLPNIEKYCQHHGYDIYVDYNYTYTERAPQWQKIKIVYDFLTKDCKYDWVFYMDIDCLIMNPYIKLESFLETKASFIVPSHGIKAQDNPILNKPYHNIITSQFFVKNDGNGAFVLNKIWEYGFTDEKYNEFDHEGRQLRRLINDESCNHLIEVVPERQLNTFWYVNNPFMVFNLDGINDNVWQKNDFIVHVTGYQLEDRIRLLSDLNYFSGVNKL